MSWYSYNLGSSDNPEKAIYWLTFNVCRLEYSRLLQFLSPCFKTHKSLKNWVDDLIKRKEIDFDQAGNEYSSYERFTLTPVSRLNLMAELAGEKNILKVVDSTPDHPAYIESKKYTWNRNDPDFHLRDHRKRWMSEVMTSLVNGTVPDLDFDYSVDSMLCEMTSLMMRSDRYKDSYRHVIKVIPTPVLLDVTMEIVDTIRWDPDWYDATRLLSVLESISSFTGRTKDVIVQKLMFNTHLIPGNISDIPKVLKECDVMTADGEFMVGVHFYFQGDYSQSVKHFCAGLKLKDSDRKWIGVQLLDLIYVSALLRDGSAKAEKLLGKIIEKNLYAVLGFHSIMLLIRAIKGENVEKMAASVREDALKTDYYSIVIQQIALVLKHLGELEEKDEFMGKYRKDIASSPNFTILHDDSFLPPYTRPSKWESTINTLMNKLGYRENDQKKTPGQPSGRVGYLLFDDFTIQPILQKTKDGVNWTKGRNIALHTFMKGIPEMTEQDMAVASKVSAYKGWYGPVTYQLKGESIAALLAGNQCIFQGDNPDIRIDIVKEEPYLVISKTRGGFKVDSNISPKDIDGKCTLRKETPSLYKVFIISTRQKEIIQTLSKMTFPTESEEQMKNLMSFLAKDIEIHTDIEEAGGRLEEVEADSRITAVLQPRDGTIAVDLYVKPFTDVSPYLTPAKGNVSVMSKKNDIPVRTVRQLKSEKENLDTVLAALGEIFPEEVQDGCTSFICEDAVSSLSVLEAFNELKEIVRIEWPEGCKFKLTGSADIKDIHINIHSSTNWFEVEGDVNVSEDKVLRLAEVLNMYRSRKGRFLEIGNGEYIAMTEKLRRQIEMLDAYSSSEKGKLKMPKVAAGALNGMEKAGVAITEDAALKRLLKNLKNSEKNEFEIPEELYAELREYQTEGYRWMCRLASWGAGACLADDMGLGKTVQTLAVLLRRAQEGPALIVAPASVMPNWSRESDRFTPSLKISIINQMQEEARKEAVISASAGDVILTTYGVLASDSELFHSVKWGTAVLDEAHIIKNKETKQSAACMGIQADFRIILTGTPLQNNLGELWNLFQFINPGILGTFNRFKEHFLTPIQEHQDKDVQKQLKRLIQPFILRRTKADVLDELPQKTEQVLYVELSENEMALYESVRRQAELELSLHQSSLVKTISDILKLRQIVCSPALVGAEIAGESSKIKELMRLVPELIAGQHRALVFSQFTSFLSLVKQTLDHEGIQYIYLDGSTPIPERQLLVKKFQKGECPLFLISLKAGGLGLNLTAADIIIHLDPWWNPAVEDQASDRAYRIGQTKPVTVYKLIAHNTIEEKITALHKSKKSLADSLLEGSDVSARLSREELLELLEH